MKASIKPERLRRGDTVAVVSPSWGGPSLFPACFDLGLECLRSRFGLKIKELPTARLADEKLYRNPKLRADDVCRAFADPEVKAVIASIGGDDSVRILPYLDMPTILENPKILMGFSDTTTLLSYLNVAGLVTFNGPSIMAGFAQMSHLPGAFADHVEQVLMNPSSPYSLPKFGVWCDGYVRWETPGYAGETNEVHVDEDGWQWLQGSGVTVGPLFGGNIEVFEFLKGTKFWPQDEFWDGRVLFLESSEEKPSVSNVKYMLRNYGSQGILNRIAGLMIGRPMHYTAEEKQQLYETVVRVVSIEFGLDHLPIVANLEFGHTDPKWVMPLGVPIRIDCDRHTLELTEAAVL